MAASVQRFRFKLSKAEQKVQLEKKYKVLQQISLPVFNPQDEEEFKNWVDEVVPVVTRMRMGVEIFQKSWIFVTVPSYANRIHVIVPPDSHKKPIDAVAESLTFEGSYIDKLERELYKIKKVEFVRSARLAAATKVARLYRLCQRSDVSYTISDRRLI